MDVIATILGLLGAVAVLSLVAQKVNLPYPAVMVVAGLGVSFIPHLPPIRIPPETMYLLLLPPLLYSGAWEMPWRDFRMNLRPILLLAIGFVAFTTFAVGAVMHAAVRGLPWVAALVLGAIVSPPDAVAAEAITDRLGVPSRVSVILKGEGLVNDASGLALYRLLVGAAVAGSFSVTKGLGQAAWMAGGGVAIGLAVGWLAVRVHRSLEEPLSETVITLLTPFVAFLPAEACGASGVLSTVVAGLYVSRLSPFVFSARLRLRAGAVWDTLTFMLNGLTFVLIGLQLRSSLVAAESEHESLRAIAGYAALLIATVVLARVVWVFPAAYLPTLLPRSRTTGRPLASWRRVFLVAYTGMRGVISLVAALSLPAAVASGAPFPRRGLIIVLAFAVIFVTLVVQALTLPALIRRLGISKGSGARCEEWEARLEAIRAALQRIDELSRDPHVPQDVLRGLRAYYGREEGYLSHAAGNRDNACEPPETPVEHIRLDLLHAQRRRLLELYAEDRINEEMLRNIEQNLDLEELRLAPP
ncbi:MAG TPA: Na+/H+ antiporter [Tepidisphaeraceae bacterium]|jgi:CPA1 family monovalent cation:H+ antiporter|nr:Na+/H+ antiporter [Tepidisphaeraceae bacterium]